MTEVRGCEKGRIKGGEDDRWKGKGGTRDTDLGRKRQTARVKMLNYSVTGRDGE